MLRSILLITLLGVCCGSIFDHSLKFPSWRKNVLRFKQEAAKISPRLHQLKSASDVVGNKRNLLDKLRSSLLIRGQPVGGSDLNALLPLFGVKKSSNQQTIKDGRVTVKSYRIANCSKQEGVFVINDLVIKPDPVSFPGNLNIAFKISVLEDITEIAAVVDFRKKIGSSWIKIPCIGEFGSCTYSDVCAMLSQIASCPAEFVEHDIPCKCPFKKSVYKEPGISFQVDGALFPSGDYKATANMTAKAGKKFLGCYDIMFTVA